MSRAHTRQLLTRAARVVWLVVLLAWLVLATMMFGVAESARAASTAPSSGSSSLSPEFEQRRDTPQTTLSAMSRQLMCPSCDTTLDHSDSPSSDRMRVWVRAAIAAGWTEDEIRSGIVAEYDGDQSVLAVPKSGSESVGAWLVPTIIVLGCALCGVLLVRRWRNQASPSSSSAQSGSSPASDPSSDSM
jgi:cytochrome c-type biogenesis protein CcmH/NrfF